MEKKEVTEKYKKINENDPFGKSAGIEITDGSVGYCRGEITIDKRHMNPLGTVHGGCLYTLADTVSGFAAGSCGSTAGPTLSGNMYFLRPTMGVNKLICEARVIKNGKRIRVVEATIYGDNGAEIARSVMEYMDMQKNLIKEEK